MVGITGASGSIYGWRLLEKLRATAGAEWIEELRFDGVRIHNRVNLNNPVLDLKS